jgi:hypothetical protein
VGTDLFLSFAERRRRGNYRRWPSPQAPTTRSPPTPRIGETASPTTLGQQEEGPTPGGSCERARMRWQRDAARDSRAAECKTPKGIRDNGSERPDILICAVLPWPAGGDSLTLEVVQARLLVGRTCWGPRPGLISGQRSADRKTGSATNGRGRDEPATGALAGARAHSLGNKSTTRVGSAPRI